MNYNFCPPSWVSVSPTLWSRLKLLDVGSFSFEQTFMVPWGQSILITWSTDCCTNMWLKCVGVTPLDKCWMASQKNWCQKRYLANKSLWSWGSDFSFTATKHSNISLSLSVVVTKVNIYIRKDKFNPNFEFSRYLLAPMSMERCVNFCWTLRWSC